ncbi:hypothetical protein [Methanoplanus limicola]|uniref:Uncharacterized protein n=1 Tax=Methanoplanus limicola DSM 2279 TaxID=937775 RepID=H1Z351_9EURY|nr:hypothetical protein [Methanoplanus limicola]EHQ35591.1 hypothetical protein Metlim_1488 [Methanoplanus limicola DSM 2279]
MSADKSSGIKKHLEKEKAEAEDIRLNQEAELLMEKENERIEAEEASMKARMAKVRHGLPNEQKIQGAIDQRD